MATFETREFSVCNDCLLFLANGSDTFTDDATETRVVAGVERLQATGGHLHAGNAEYGFSSRVCECCQSPLSGDRFEAIRLTPQAV